MPRPDGGSPPPAFSACRAPCPDRCAIFHPVPSISARGCGPAPSLGCRRSNTCSGRRRLRRPNRSTGRATPIRTGDVLAEGGRSEFGAGSQRLTKPRGMGLRTSVIATKPAAQATAKLEVDSISGEGGYAVNRRPRRFGRALVRLREDRKGGRRNQQGSEQHHDHGNQNGPIGYAGHRGTPSPRFRLMVRRTIAIPNITLIRGGQFLCSRSRSREWGCATQQMHLPPTAAAGSSSSLSLIIAAMAVDDPRRRCGAATKPPCASPPAALIWRHDRQARIPDRPCA